jgi:3-(3-hydroxy-phenyl)propionate hydroxylase
MFIQPQVLTDAGTTVLLDEVIGENFAIIAWGCDPTWGLTAEQIAQWKALGTRFIQVLPDVQLRAPSDAGPDVIRVGDCTGRLKEWFARGTSSMPWCVRTASSPGWLSPKRSARPAMNWPGAQSLPQPAASAVVSKVA